MIKEITEQRTKANFWLLLSIALYFVMNGAQLWETVIMIPAWTQAPPASLIFFKEPYGLDFKNFWIVVHSIHDLSFILALYFNWKIPKRKKWLVILFAVHMGVRIWTLIYFVPVIMEFQQMTVSNTIEPGLVEKAAEWRNLNYIRVGLYFLVNICLLFLFNINSNKRES